MVFYILHFFSSEIFIVLPLKMADILANDFSNVTIFGVKTEKSLMSKKILYMEASSRGMEFQKRWFLWAAG